MPRRFDLTLDRSLAAQFTGAGTSYVVQTPTGVLYMIFVDNATDLVYRKSTDGGYTWSKLITVFTGSVTAFSIWYDRWSNISAGLIHMVYTDSGIDDTLYRTINTESADALSTETTLFAGASTAGGGHLSVTRAVGGNVYCKTVIDAGVEGGFFRLPNANVPNGAWDAARTVDEVIATTDQMILLPDYDAADNQDIMAIFWDASANEWSRKLYDDSANSWSETAFGGTATDSAASIAFPHFDVAPDPANTRHIVVGWNNLDALNSDLTCWVIDSGSITQVTDVVSNSTDDQGLCAISIDQEGTWWVFYGGKTDGSETFPTAMNIYCKGSSDGGTTWGPETLLTKRAYNLCWLASIPKLLFGSPKPPLVAFLDNASPVELYLNISSNEPRVTLELGV